MTVLTVGSGQEYSAISAAVAASSSGDTIDVQAGTYTNDFVTITHDLTLSAVGGTVTMVATEQPPDGKAMIDEGGSGVSVTITGFDISGVTVPDGNGAAIRYEGGNLTLNNDNFHDNQEGLLGADDANGTISIESSTFANNGTGTGYTHNIYVGNIASLTVDDSTITNAIGGHDIKSRAASTTITDNTITDGSSGTASYEIDLPNGGNATITGNVIEKGASASNPVAISFGEEGSVYASSSLTVSGNTMLNDDTSHNTTALVNDASITAVISDNTLYGWTSVSSGLATVTGSVILTTEPVLSSLTTGTSGAVATSSGETSTGSASSSGTTTTSTAETSTDSTTATAVTTESETTSGSTASLTDVSSHSSSAAWGWNGGETASTWSGSDTQAGAGTGSSAAGMLIEQSSARHDLQQMVHPRS